MKYILTGALIICSLFSMASGDDDSTAKKQTLPEVTIKNIDNENIDFSEYATNGKLTIVSFWATWCKPCIKELKNVSALLEDWEEEYNVELVAVSVDDARTQSKVRTFVNGMGWDFDVLLDPNGELQRAMNVTNPPVTFLIDQDGNIVYTHTGYLEGDEYDLEDEIKKHVKQ